MAYLQVEDTGPGLSEQEHERIFEPFTRANTPGISAPGAGLGLTIAKMLTDLMGGELTVQSTLGVGSLFQAKLFLPELSAAGAVQSVSGAKPLTKLRLAYAGARRHLLVVDNEEADRDLLVSLLKPLGFELRTAASGHDCLDLLAAGYHPDVILMDLAMPGIDGWETIRRVRALEGAGTPRIAIVSANAFDRGLDNDVGIRAQDFILKPVRHAELLDWLERQLALVWLDQPTPPAPLKVSTGAGPAVRAELLPSSAHIAALREFAALGYVRGLLKALDAIESEQPECASFTDRMRTLTRQFAFDSMLAELSTAAAAPEGHP
jgi:CheY-like chemotaxis protein